MKTDALNEKQDEEMLEAILLLRFKQAFQHANLFNQVRFELSPAEQTANKL